MICLEVHEYYIIRLRSNSKGSGVRVCFLVRRHDIEL